MPSKTTKVIGLSAALAALAGPAALSPTAAAAADVDASVSPDAGSAAPMIQMPVNGDLMNFTVGQREDGTIVADHSSHASHASHSSHSSHVSSR